MGLSRSAQMRRIKGRDTGPEVLLRRHLWAAGARYRLHLSTPGGRPDGVFPGARLAVFIDGCQWHGCPEHYVRPRSNAEFWADKLATNVSRDRRQTASLHAAGWRVLRFWEHEVYMDVAAVTVRVLACLAGESPSAEVALRVFKVDPVDLAGQVEDRHLVGLQLDGPERVDRQPRHTRKWRRPGVPQTVSRISHGASSHDLASSGPPAEPLDS